MPWQHFFNATCTVFLRSDHHLVTHRHQITLRATTPQTPTYATGIVA
jgi:hypothetical protein